jgi:hypothetical protein
MRIRALAVIGILAACGSGSGYPMPAEPPTTWAHVPVAIHDAGWVTVLFLELEPGHRIELVDAEPIGVADGATTTFFVSPPVVDPDGDIVIGEAREPLVGWTFSVPDGAAPTASVETTFGIVAEITPQRPGRYVLESVRLTYRLNGGPDQKGDGIDTVLVVCADDPAPAECEDFESG